MVNRVGDFGFALGIFGVFVLFDSVNFDVIFANAASFAGEGGNDQVVLNFLGYALGGGTLDWRLFLLFFWRCCQ